jgi:hypothetical protein
MDRATTSLLIIEHLAADLPRAVGLAARRMARRHGGGRCRSAARHTSGACGVGDPPTRALSPLPPEFSLGWRARIRYCPRPFFSRADTYGTGELGVAVKSAILSWWLIVIKLVTYLDELDIRLPDGRASAIVKSKRK